MGSIFSGLFGGSDTKKDKAPEVPTDTAAAKAQADTLRRRQGGGLSTQTNTSGFRNMVSASGGSLKQNLGSA